MHRNLLDRLDPRDYDPIDEAASELERSSVAEQEDLHVVLEASLEDDVDQESLLNQTFHPEYPGFDQFSSEEQ